MLEEGSFRGRTADFVFMFLFGAFVMTVSFLKNHLPADNLIKYKKKHTPKNKHLVNSRFELLKQDNNFAVIFRLYFKVIFEVSPQNCCLVFKSSNLEFTRCCFSECVFFL